MNRYVYKKLEIRSLKISLDMVQEEKGSASRIIKIR